MSYLIIVAIALILINFIWARAYLIKIGKLSPNKIKDPVELFFTIFIGLGLLLVVVGVFSLLIIMVINI